MSDLDIAFSAADFAGKEVPPRAWFVPDLIPHGTVTLLSGDGGLGKSTLGLQLAAASALGRDWLGREVRKGVSLVLSAEDDRDELHRRIHEVSLFYGCDLEDLADVILMPMADKSAMLSEVHEDGTLIPTALVDDLADLADKHHPSLIILDSLADVFGGNEINRAHARQFAAANQNVPTVARGFDAASYLSTNPDVAAEYARHTSGKDRDYLASLGVTSAADFAAWHYRVAGQSEGRQPFATGGVFSNGVVTRPTSFDMGLMGEAGPEAIMPLENVGGRLGVRASGGGDNAELIAEVRSLRAELAQVVMHTSKSATKLERLERNSTMAAFSGVYVRGEVPGDPVKTEAA